MCLRKVNKPKKDSGIGYKVVWPLGNGEYKPQWRLYYPDGHGRYGYSPDSILDSEDCDNLDEGKAIEVTARYRLGVSYTVDHNHVVTKRHWTRKRSTLKSYPAGVYLYKSLKEALFTAQLCNETPVIIRCSYSKAVACCGGVVVAMEMTPLNEVPVR